MSDFPDDIACADNEKEILNEVRKALEGARQGVLFTTYNGGQELINTVTSIKSQSWLFLI